MLTYVLAGLVILLLAILFRYLPRRVFGIFVLLLILAGIVGFQLRPPPQENVPLTQEQMAAITHEQELFTPWWDSYQRQIAELDRDWTRYHQILTDAKTGEVELSVTYARLVDLEEDMRDLQSRMEKNAVPKELSDGLYDPLASIVQKTNNYFAAEQKAITLTRAAADPAAMKEQNPAEQARLLELVLLRESPIALFIEDEIGSIRSYLAPVSVAHTKPEEHIEER